MKLKDKIAIVTGSGRGIGRGIAGEFIREGAVVVLATIDEAEGREAEREILEAGGRAWFVQTDVQSEESVARMVEQSVEKFGRIDVLVNNAGITLFKSLQEATLADWERVINIDLRGVFLCSKYAVKYMTAQGCGSIVQISSTHARSTFPNAEMYAAAKAGILGMTRSMALSLGRDGVRVNAICPGFVENSPNFRDWLRKKAGTDTPEKALYDVQALSSICQPEDVGKLAVFLASDDSRMITGTEIVIDGGLSLRLHQPFYP